MPLITKQPDLDSVVADLGKAGRFAVDTEFVGALTYIPRLCLIQVATTSFVALIDPMAEIDLGGFWDLVASTGIQKVLHAAREDLRLAYHSDGRVARNVFDTQIAAGLIGMPQYPTSYARLVEALSGVRLSKTETRSEWDRRPLTPEQIRYARDDVRYLLPIADTLAADLQGSGRADWMSQEMDRFSEPNTYMTEPDDAYLRLRAPRGGLSARTTAVLRALAAWRERDAAERNVPTRTILRDETLLDLAVRAPKRANDLGRARNFPSGEEGRLGPGIIAAITEAVDLRPGDLPEPLRGNGDETLEEHVLLDLLTAIGQAVCLQSHVAPELAVTRSYVADLMSGLDSCPLLAGWRRDIVGGLLVDLSAGRSAIRASVKATAIQIDVD